MGSCASLLLAPGQALGLSFPTALHPLFLVCCLGGLRRIIYAFGLGYGFCMLASGVFTLSEAPASSWATCACALYGGYGVRLVTFLCRRQACEAYNNSKHGRELNAKMDKTPLPIKAMVCVFVSLTQLATAYALQPISMAEEMPTAGWVGLGMGIGGLILEAVADEEKLFAKKQRPDDPVMSGSFSIVRHPNYLGEILFWAGITVASQAALPSSATLSSRLQGSLGPLLMIWVMIGAAKRLDKTAESKYENNAGYKAYATRTPSLWPFLRPRAS
eukprot:TRINITY_DN99829_c0_g1_i1.p1 TRINITY_DN99829_c0_g1~~TRINITY_DN99829_c0_g1_i1.p1  ORF type:complete len:284 (+),score=42.03 TRINITY_DN99829_c0_g1_i1:31-852(+)